ncbi:MAG: hypothetical protein K6F33_13690, partial [Bacteroidales bacterium]|nr:hypothetical protein [Bacteroidales bacterium]
NSVFQKLDELATVAHLGSEQRDSYEAALKKYRDSYDIFETAREDGLEEGRAEGERLANERIARNLVSLGVPIDKIVKATGLTVEEISNL